MSNKYVIANIRIPLVVLSNGNFEPMTEYITMDIEPCIELPEKKDISSFYNEINAKIFSMCSVLQEKTPPIPEVIENEIASTTETNPFCIEDDQSNRSNPFISASKEERLIENGCKDSKEEVIILKEDIDSYRNMPHPTSHQKTLKVFQKRSFANKTAKRKPGNVVVSPPHSEETEHIPANE